MIPLLKSRYACPMQARSSAIARKWSQNRSSRQAGKATKVAGGASTKSKHVARRQDSWNTYKKTHPTGIVGAGLSSAVHDDVAKRRIDVVESFVRAGVPLAKVDHLRPQVEMKPLKAGLAENLSVIFDGSTYQGEALAILVRYIDNDWKPQQRLVRFHVLAKSLSGAELAGELVAALSTAFPLKPASS